jgi:hypothetical protein
MFFFDLISETPYNVISLSDSEDFIPESASPACERGKTKDLYTFTFSDKNLATNNHSGAEYITLTIKKHELDESLKLTSSTLTELDIKAPLKHRGFISGLCDVVYDKITDTFVIPCLQRNIQSVSDKSFLALTVGYEYNPELNIVAERTRDGTNPVKLLTNNCAVPLDKKRLSSQVQDNMTGLLPVLPLNDGYAVVNPSAEVMAIYSGNELFGHRKEKINEKSLDNWNEQQHALYTLFTFKNHPAEVATNVYPDIRVVQKLQFLNNNRLKTAKCRAFCRTCSRTNRVLEQVY